MRLALVGALALVALLLTGGLRSIAAAPAQHPVVLAAGDIAGCSSNGDEQTAALLDKRAGTVLALGDLAYEFGTPDEFRRCFGPSWGRHKKRIRPAPGNHEYGSGGTGYFRYFGRPAGPGERGYYSFDLGEWHIVSLNSERDTGRSGAQARWLRNDLARSEARCVLAFWHVPRWSAGKYRDDARTAAFWDTLYAARADVVLTAHDHNYQRFAPLDRLGRVDRARGMRSFVVGTGGRGHYELQPDPRRRAASAGVFGVLELTLRPTSYRWRFLPVPGARFRDSGSARCSP
jgi:acid phosphatase type 7